MSRHSRTSHVPTSRRPRPARSFPEKVLVEIGTVLALTGALAAAAAAVFSIIPATSAKVDPALRVPVGPLRQARAIGLDHAGGDLRRAPRLTRRARRLGFGTPWMDGISVLPKQATYSVLVAPL